MERLFTSQYESVRGSSWVSLEETKSTPSPRSLHTMVYLDRFIYVFGGYDGTKRTNDFYKFDIISKEWLRITTNDLPPSPRERHVAVVHDRSIFIFAGYDGVNRLNDFYEFNTDNNTWQEVIYSGSGLPPSARHSSCAIVFDGSMYVFGGYDGNCKSDLHRFNFETNTWNEIKKLTGHNSWPRERYRTSATLYKTHMYIYGGHDGSKQLEDFWAFDLKYSKWKLIEVKPSLPSLRDSHLTFTYRDSLYIHGGSSANNIYHKGDFFEFNFDLQKWTGLKYYINDNSSNHVFCHGGVFVDKQEAFYIFGGYNGVTRLNDFKYFKMNDDDLNSNLRSQSFVKNMESYINNKKFSDVTLISSDKEKIYAHKIILSRIPYFENLFNSDLMESFQNEILIENVCYSILLKIIKYVYTSFCNVEYEDAISLYEAANYFGLDDLKRMCEDKILSISSIENACEILIKADEFNSIVMKDRIIKYIVDNFHSVALTDSFTLLLKNNELALEVIRTFALNKNPQLNKLNCNSSSNSFIN